MDPEANFYNPLITDAPARRGWSGRAKLLSAAAATMLGVAALVAVAMFVNQAPVTGETAKPDANPAFTAPAFAATPAPVAIQEDEEEQPMLMDLYHGYLLKHNKGYASPKELATRYENFKATVERVQAMNENKAGAVYGLDKFADWSEEEFRATYLMPRFDANDQCKWPYHKLAAASANAAPTEFDWTTKGAVTPVKNQAACGSCWAFSTTGNIEGQYFLKNNKLISLSEQDLVDCDHECLPSNPQLCDAGCGGGLPWNAYNYVEKSGLVLEADYPYKGVGGQCASAGKTVATKVANWTALSTDQADIEAYLVKNGPLSITINAGPLMSYKSGVINVPTSSCSSAGMDHAVLLVGYGTDSATGLKYWKVKNSWDTTWGEEGYFRIASEQGLCGINLCVTSALM